MPPSDLAVVGGGRRAGHAGSVRCGFGFGSALPCRALPPAGRAHARLMRAPLAARSAGAARVLACARVGGVGWSLMGDTLNPLDCRSLRRLVLLVLCSHPPRLSRSWAAWSAGAALSSASTVALFCRWPAAIDARRPSASLWYYVLQIDYCTLPYLGGFVGQFCGLFFALGWVW